MAPALGTQPNNWSNQSSAGRNGFDAEIAELYDLRGAVKDVKSRTIYKPAHSTSVTDMMLNWDGERILFTAADENQRWGVYEVNRDGSNFHKVIEVPEPDLEFMDGGYMPDGTIMAMSNIGYQGVPCVNGDDQVGNMIKYDPRTGEMRRMTFDQDANWHPRVMNNGRLMYVRWEYTDLTHYYSRFVMHANPDGTETKALYGSGGWFPNSIFDVQPLPGGNSTFVGIISGHHGVARSGRMILFDPAMGRKETKGMIQEVPFGWRPIEPLIKDELVNGVWPQFIKPWPLDDRFFLVSAKLDENTPWGIYLVDVYDNMTLVAMFEGEGLINPIMVGKRPVPPVIPDRIKPDDKEATFFIQDIYQGEGLPGVPVGTVKKLRVFAYEYAYVDTPSDHTAQGIQSGWDIKRVLGEVDVEPDGSVRFKAPANTPISMQPLDSEGRALQWMRSWVTGMPGEVVSCVGCHEDQNSMPIPKRAMASIKPPKPLEVPEGGVRSFTYELEVQPILDRACVACHGENSSLDLRGDRGIERVITNKRSNRGQELITSKSYIALHPFVNRQGPEADIYVMKPYEYHASTSELVKILKRGHHGVSLSETEWRKLYEWIDLNAPYHGQFVDNTVPYCPTNQYDRRIELANKYGNGAGVDWRGELEAYAAWLENRGTPRAVRPARSPRPEYTELQSAGWPLDEARSKALVAGADARREVELAPGVKVTFVRIPAGTFVMGKNSLQEKNNLPASIVEIEKPFWMSETELTNEQYNALRPGHDSRYIAQFWKDHVGPGYAANRPGQPVIRISWNEAVEYCKALSEKTGLRITLPTEAQWEWACRAGSAGDMWYGAVDTSFADFENMADASLSDMAVTGIDPQPMKHDNPSFPFYNFLPRDPSVNDGNMVVSDVAKYKPNPGGLYDMHGNVAEFTRSEASAESGVSGAGGDLKIYRGGSWIDRPKNSTAWSRNEALAWQPLNNVGVRLVIED
jgi:formylglycine-generating enzyme required for sulfatase activity